MQKQFVSFLHQPAELFLEQYHTTVVRVTEHSIPTVQLHRRAPDQKFACVTHSR